MGAMLGGIRRGQEGEEGRCAPQCSRAPTAMWRASPCCAQVEGDELLGRLGLSAALGSTPSRANAGAMVLESLRRRVRSLARDLPRFPSLVIARASLTPQGAFAEAQAEYLRPRDAEVRPFAPTLPLLSVKLFYPADLP